MDGGEVGASAEELVRSAIVCVVGAGGLGCELCKSLAVNGFKHIHVLDMDTIELSNLNRQFLFREQDVGQPKAVVAARVIGERFPDVEVIPHFTRLEDMDDAFYSQFNVLIAGLDSVVVRMVLSRRLVEMKRRDGVGPPYIDGAAELWQGHVKLIVPDVNACMQCQEWAFTPEDVVQMCTFVSHPRQPAHCVAYAMHVFPQSHDDRDPDLDSEEDIEWLFAAAAEHAAKYRIEGVTLESTRGYAKRIVPAIASTQAIVASMCATEAYKWVTTGSSCLEVNNHFQISGRDGVHGGASHVARNPDCLVCAAQIVHIPLVAGETVEGLLARLGATFGYPAASLGNPEPVYGRSFPWTRGNLTRPVEEFALDVQWCATAPGQRPLQFVFEDPS